MFLRKCALVLGASSLLTLAACKPAVDSEVQTLDELASGDEFNGNKQCSGNFAPQFVNKDNIKVNGTPCSQDAANPLCASVMKTLTAIPTELQYLYFNYYNLSIKVSAEATANCGLLLKDQNSMQFVSDDGRRKIDGCFIQTKDASNKPVFVVHLKNEEASISRNLVRVLGMFTSQVLPKTTTGADGKFVYNSADPDQEQYANYKYLLVEKFLKDLYGIESGENKLENSKKFNFNSLALYFGEGALGLANVKILHDNIKNNQMLDFAAINSSDKRGDIFTQRFKDTVMGEAFDSGLCTDLTNKFAISAFPKTIAYFNDVTKFALVEFSKTLMSAKGIRQQPQQNSMGLAAASVPAGTSFGMMPMNMMWAYFFPMLMQQSGSMFGSAPQRAADGSSADGLLAQANGGCQSCANGSCGGNCPNCVGGTCGPGCTCPGCMGLS